MKILIIAPNWVGDLVMAQTLMMELKKENNHLTVLAPKFLFDVLKAMSEVDEILESPLKHKEFDLKTYKSFAVTLEGKFDKAFILPNSFKSALIPFFAKIPQRYGWLGEARYFLLNETRSLDKNKYPLMIERFLALNNWTLPVSYPKPRLQASKVDDKFNLKSQKTLVLCPGAEFGIAKQWLLSHWQGLALYFINQGFQVVLLGSFKDKDFTDKIASVKPAIMNLAGQTSLKDAIAILNIADCVVSNDSGLMHIACDLNKKTIAIYGSTSPDFTPPLSENAIVLQGKTACSPCFRRQCPYNHYNCLKNISASKVIDIIESQI